MPRGISKTASKKMVFKPTKTAASTKTTSTSQLDDIEDDADFVKEKKPVKRKPVKKEVQVQETPAEEGNSSIDLSQFKFEKKPHVKIEYEYDSPVKEEPKGLWEPPNWKDFLLNLKIMRANNDAPVDSMGCHMCMGDDVPPEVYRYQSLISLMLSSQTKDQVTFAAMERLRKRGLTVDSVLEMSDEELGQLIYPVGFWKTKVKYIKKTTQTLKEQYNGDIPDSVQKLCKLTGVGPKMAHICMKVAWNKITGIGVDTHVHRISNRIGWVKKATPTPEDTRKALEAWLPFDLWSEVNHLMVGFGQTICTPISPICNECLNRDICPSSGEGRKTPKKTPIKNVKQEIKLEPESVQQEKSPGKRAVTPKKEAAVKNLFDDKKATVSKSPNKAKASEETLNVKPEKSAPKRKVTPKKTMLDKHNTNNSTELNVAPQISKTKSPKVKKVATETTDTVKVNKKTPQKEVVTIDKPATKRKSPRNKVNEAEDITIKKGRSVKK